MITQEFVSQFAQVSPSDLSDLLARYVVQVGASDIPAMAQALTSAIWGAVPQDEDEQPRLLSIADFYDSVGDPPPALVSELLPDKKLIAFSGAAKQGKSLVALDILHRVSEGTRLMDRFDVRQAGVVVYFGLEDGADEIKSRLMQRGIRADNHNIYVCSQSFDIAQPAGFETYKRLIADLPEPPVLVVIDTAREGFRLRDWNDASLVGAAISPLRQWAQKHCSVMLITHNNKDKGAVGVNKVSGSSALVSSCDCVMVLENQTVLVNSDLQWEWDVIGGRGLRPAKHTLVMDTNNLHVRVLGAEEAAAAKSDERATERHSLHGGVARHMAEQQPLRRATAKQIMTALDLGYDLVIALLKEMGSAGEVVKTKDLMPQPLGRPAPLYELTEKGMQTYLLKDPALGKQPQQISPTPKTAVVNAGEDDTEEF